MRPTDSASTSPLNSSVVVNKNETDENTTVTIDERKKHAYHEQTVLHLQILSGKIIPCHVSHGYCVTLLSLFQIPASLTCSKLCGVQGGAGQDHHEGQVHQGQHHHSGLHHQAEDGGD